MDLSTLKAQEEQSDTLQSLKQKQLMYNVSIPTDDFRVREILRDLSEPITLFGENNGSRRMRLKELVATRASFGEDLSYLFQQQTQEEEEVQKEEFLTIGSQELLNCRKHILAYSIPKAIERRNLHRNELKIPFAKRKKLRFDFYHNLQVFSFKQQEFQSDIVQFGDDRPLGFCCFSPNSKLLATSSWGGVVKLWNVPKADLASSFHGHKDRVSGIAWHPDSTRKPTSIDFASGASDGSVHLWSLNQQHPKCSLIGHKERISRLAFHPSGRYIGTASFDTSWRLWDAETTQELLLQEGHSRKLFAIGFQPDGALVATGGYDAIGRVWDLRTGRSIMVLRSHIKPILSLDWSPNGYQLATGGEDNTIKVWDMRKKDCVYTIPSHTNLVSSLRYWHATDAFESKKYDTWTLQNHINGMEIDADQVTDAPDTEERRNLLSGSFLVSSSFDGTCKIWTDGDFKPVKSLSGVEGKVMCCDISGDAKYIVTALYDRTFKLFYSPNIM